MLTALKQDIDRLKKKSISNNTRIFGLKVDKDLNVPGIIKLVIKNVLKVACPSTDWVPDDIKSVKVMEKNSQNGTPIVIITFRHDADKFCFYDGRSEFRK